MSRNKLCHDFLSGGGGGGGGAIAPALTEKLVYFLVFLQYFLLRLTILAFMIPMEFIL